MPTTMTDLIARVRAEIGDPAQPFRTTALGNGVDKWFDLPKQQIMSINECAIIQGADFTTLTDVTAVAPWISGATYMTGQQVSYNGDWYQASAGSTAQTPGPGSSFWTDVTATVYTLNSDLGQVQLGAPVPNNATLVMAGESWQLFTDTELTNYVGDAVNQHCFNRTITERLRDARGFLDYRESALSLANLPSIEVPLIVMLGTVNVFWTLANDTASDFNIQTAEGTSINRTAQYNQIMSQIGALTERYQDLCGQLNVGVYRMETLQLRRSSYTTGRLVPLFTPREYDDHRWPERELPSIDGRNQDNSGIPSQYWVGNQGF